MQTIATPHAPEAIGPYSQAIDTGALVFCSGQVPLVPETMKLIEGGIEPQTDQVLKNLTQVLGHAGLSLSDIVKTTVYLSDLNDFAAMNAVYARHLGDHKPARATVQVARLPLDSLVEIECIAARPIASV